MSSFLALVAFALAGPIFGPTSPALALSRAANLTSPDATVGPAHQVADPVPGVPQSVGGGPGLAFGGTNHLAAWQDDRGGIWAARVAPSGAVLDGTGFPVNDRRYGRDPEVAFDGTNFLVVWADGQSVLARRVGPDGTVLDADDLTLTTDSDGLSPPSIAFDGANYLVVWGRWGVEGTTLSDVAGRRVSPSGALVDPSELVVSATPSHQIHPRIAFNGSQHLVVWQTDLTDLSNVAGTRVTTDGTAVDPAGIPISTGAAREAAPAVTAVGSSFLVVWEDARSGPSWDIYGTAVDDSGTVVAPAGVPLGTAPSSEGEPMAVSNGTDALVTWQDGQAVRARRVDGSGQPLDPSSFELPGTGFHRRAAFDGTNYLVAGARGNLAQPTAVLSVVGTRVSPTGAVLDPTPIAISVAANAQRQLDMASGGVHRLVVWIDNRPGAPGLYGGRVGPDGLVIDGTGFPIALGTGITTPTVAFDGTHFLVAWADGTTGIFAAQVTAAGEVSPTVTLSTPAVGTVSEPAVAFGGGTFLVAWAHHEINEHLVTFSQVRVSRVSTDGAVIDPDGVRLTPDQQMEADSPSVVFGGSEFLVVWHQARNFFPTGYDIHGARVTTSGAVVEGELPVSGTEENQYRPDVAWNGDRYLVVWQEQPAGSAEWEPMDVRGARLTGDAEVEDTTALAIAVGPEDQRAPSVAANGPFLVTWTQRREDGDTDVLATEVEPNGYIGHPGGFVVAGGPAPELDAVVTAAPGERNFSVAFQGLVTDAPYGTYRASTSDVHVAPK